MKIDGKKAVETSRGWHGVVENDGERERLTTPRLQARPEGTAKLMQAKGCASQAMAAAVQAGNMHWVPYETLCNPDTPAFPGNDRRVEVLRSQDLPAGQAGTIEVFNEGQGDERIVEQHKRNVVRHFANTWPSRLPYSQQAQVEQGRYFLTDPDGRSRQCSDYPDFARFIGAGQTGDLPERVLHVAGPQLHNFLCQTYLYNPALSLFGHAGQRRVEPMPNLRTVYDVARNQHGQVQVRYMAHDDALDRAMLVGTEDHDEHEASALTPASIRFSGTLLFSPDGACAIGPVRVHATAMQFAEPTALAVTDSFA